MVFNRIKALRILFIAILTFIFSILLLKNNNEVETNLAKSILPQEIIENSQIINIMNKQSQTVKVIFEAEDESALENLKQNFLQNIDKKSFTLTNPDFIKLVDWYSKAPSNYISPQTRKLLLNKNYDAVKQQGLERLYNPTGIPVVELAKDPFLLLTDFLVSIKSNSAGSETVERFNNNKIYDTETLKINPELKKPNAEIAKLVKLQNTYSHNGNKIYLGGTPVHTYHTSVSSSVSINTICILITALIIFLTYFYFKNFRILLPIALSIAFGFLTGFSVSKTIFNSFHIVTFLFGTTLIGIGIDYSYHYIFAEKINKDFIKDLTLSLLSTIMAFSLLYFLKIDVLNQIATFTNSGLIAIYIFILTIYPCINFPKPVRFFQPEFNKKFKTGIIILLAVIIAAGIIRLHFNDSLSALYTPSKKLLKAEQLFNEISNQTADRTTIIAVKGNSLQNLLEEEEEITSQLDKANTTYICISKFIPSIKRQQENEKLTKLLYKNKLNEYKDILSTTQINQLLNQNTQPQTLNLKDFPFFNDLLLNPQTSIIISFSDKVPEIKSSNIEVIDFQGTISNYLKLYRIGFLKILPVIYLLLYLILFFSYGFKQSLKMFLPLVISSVFVISFVSLIGVELNLFNLLGLLLALGFTVDYAIFGRKNLLKSETAIFLACITTALSFLLLSFTTFKLISTLSLTTSLGVLFNYLLIEVFTVKK